MANNFLNFFSYDEKLIFFDDGIARYTNCTILDESFTLRPLNQEVFSPVVKDNITYNKGDKYDFIDVSMHFSFNRNEREMSAGKKCMSAVKYSNDCLNHRFDINYTT